MKERSQRRAGGSLQAFTALTLVASAMCYGADATSPAAQRFDIPAQSTGDALNAFSKQSGLRLLFSYDAVAGRQADAVSGSYTPEEVLKKLLAGTGLQYEVTADSVVLIRERDAVSSSKTTGALGSEGTSAGSFQFGDATLRLAQNDQDSRNTENRNESSASAAGNSEDKFGKLEEIVVTAQRREQNLQDVPIALSVFTGQQLDMSSQSSVNKTIFSVPGLNITTQTAGGVPAISIRGVSSLLGSATVGYYVDGVPFGLVANDFSPDPGPFDIDRVEVLRGPQGTLYGANSLNGVVRVLTKDADLNHYEVKGRILVANTQGGGDSYGANAAVNMPIIANKLAARLAVGYNHTGGYIDNLVAKEINDNDSTNIRFKINAQPTNDLSVKLGYWRSVSDDGSLSLSYRDRDFYPGDLNPRNVTIFDVYSGTVGYDFGSFKVLNTTSYLDYYLSMDVDWSAFTRELTFFGLSGMLNLSLTSKVFTNELSFLSQSDGPWSWSAGAMYRDAKDDAHYYTPLFPIAPSLAESTSDAVFGELGRSFAGGAMELTGGLRYFHDKVRQTEPGGTYNRTSTFNHVSPRVVLNWHPKSNMTVYASYSQGFRSGLNQPASTEATNPGLPPAKADSLNNYEVGSKGRLFNDFLSYEVAAYYIDWTDVKQALTINLGSNGFGGALYTNAGSARGPGADVGLIFHLNKQLSIGATGSWNDLVFKEVVLMGTDVLYKKGDRPAGSTKYTLGGSINYRTPLGKNGLEGVFSGSVDYKSATESVVVNNRTPGDAITLGRLALQIARPRTWTLEVFCDNLFNERGVKNPDGFVFIYNHRTPPRVIGTQFSVHY